MVLLYWPKDETTKNTVKKILQDENLQVKEIGLDDLNKPILEIMEEPESETIRVHTEEEPFLFLDTADRETISRVDAALKEEGIRIDQKAVLTEHNGKWKLRDLMREIQREDAYFKKREKLYNVLSHPDKKRLQEDEDYKKVMMMAFTIFNSQKAEEKDYDAILKVLDEIEK